VTSCLLLCSSSWCGWFSIFPLGTGGDVATRCDALGRWLSCL
jgi:hypothetical protein